MQAIICIHLYAESKVNNCMAATARPHGCDVISWIFEFFPCSSLCVRRVRVIILLVLTSLSPVAMFWPYTPRARANTHSCAHLRLPSLRALCASLLSVLSSTWTMSKLKSVSVVNVCPSIMSSDNPLMLILVISTLFLEVGSVNFTIAQHTDSLSGSCSHLALFFCLSFFLDGWLCLVIGLSWH